MTKIEQIRTRRKQAHQRLLESESKVYEAFLKMEAVAILLGLLAESAPACTGFALKEGDRVLACLSYDHQFGAGHVYVNKRNVERARYQLLAEKPFLWVSKYGSITFDLVGRDCPYDGMNEAGLVDVSMGLDGSQFPPPDSRAALDELGWIQYQLDAAASVEEVVRSLEKVRISSRSIGDSHYLIVDRTGKAAVLEYVSSQTRLQDERGLAIRLSVSPFRPRQIFRGSQLPSSRCPRPLIRVTLLIVATL